MTTAGLGLALLIIGIVVLVLTALNTLGWVLVVGGLAVIVFGFLAGRGRVV
jgi:hypothetical protein